MILCFHSTWSSTHTIKKKPSMPSIIEDEPLELAVKYRHENKNTLQLQRVVYT